MNTSYKQKEEKQTYPFSGENTIKLLFAFCRRVQVSDLFKKYYFFIYDQKLGGY